MDINFTFRNVEPINVEAFRKFTEKKFKKVKKYLIKPIDVSVILTSEKFRNIVEVTIFSNGGVIKGSHESSDPYDAIINVMAKVENQARKQKERSKDFYK